MQSAMQSELEWLEQASACASDGCVEYARDGYGGSEEYERDEREEYERDGYGGREEYASGGCDGCDENVVCENVLSIQQADSFAGLSATL